jgi:hypothetical protein
MTTRIDVEEVRRLQARRREINALPLAEIEWCENGAPIDLPAGCMTPDEWSFVGLTNIDYFDFEVDGEE